MEVKGRKNKKKKLTIGSQLSSLSSGGTNVARKHLSNTSLSLSHGDHSLNTFHTRSAVLLRASNLSSRSRSNN